MGLPWQLIKASTSCRPIFWLRKQLRQEKAISQVAVLIAYTANYNIAATLLFNKSNRDVGPL